MGEYEDLLEELDAMDVNALRDRIQQLQGQRSKQWEFQERLQEKLKASNSELAARQVEYQFLQEQLEEVRAKNKRIHQEMIRDQQNGELMPDGELGHSSTQEDKQIASVLDIELQNLAGPDFVPDADVTKIELDETHLMVSKESEATSRDIDTVLIIFIPNFEDPDVKYTLTYRVHGTTTVNELRVDACTYWGVSTGDFVFRTVGYNAKLQERMQINQCFRPGELSQLVLIRKQPKNSFILEHEKRAAYPKKGGFLQRQETEKDKEEDEDAVPGQKNKKEPSFLEQLDAMPGLRELLLRKDMRVSLGQPPRFRDLFMYLMILMLTFALFTQERSFRQEYLLSDTLVTRFAKNIGYNDIVTSGDFWDWLSLLEREITYGDVANDFTIPLGYLRLRQQRVRPVTDLKNDAGCTLAEAAEQGRDKCKHMRGLAVKIGVCYAQEIDANTVEDRGFDRAIWSGFDAALSAQDPKLNGDILDGTAGTTSLYDTGSWDSLLSDSTATIQASEIAGAARLVSSTVLRDLLNTPPPTDTFRNQLDTNPKLKVLFPVRRRTSSMEDLAAEIEQFRSDQEVSKQRDNRNQDAHEAPKHGARIANINENHRVETKTLSRKLQTTLNPPIVGLLKRKGDPKVFVKAEDTPVKAVDDPLENDASQTFPGESLTSRGQLASYDNSGFETLFQVDFLHQTLRKDIPVLRKASWIDQGTRMVDVNLILYNGNLDFFMACQFLVEFPAIGTAVANAPRIIPFRANIMETRDETQIYWWLDVARLVLVLLFVGCWVMRRDILGQSEGCLNQMYGSDDDTLKDKCVRYFMSFIGLVDVLTIFVFMVVFAIRYVIFSSATITSAQDTSSAKPTFIWNVVNGQITNFVDGIASTRLDLSVLDCVFGVLIGIRILYYPAKISRHLWIMLNAVGAALKLLIQWAFLMPLVICFFLCFHVAVGHNQDGFRDAGSAFTSVLLLWDAKGRNVDNLRTPENTGVLVCLLTLFCLLSLLVSYVFVAVLNGRYAFYNVVLGGWSYPKVSDDGPFYAWSNSQYARYLCWGWVCSAANYVIEDHNERMGRLAEKYLGSKDASFLEAGQQKFLEQFQGAQKKAAARKAQLAKVGDLKNLKKKARKDDEDSDEQSAVSGEIAIPDLFK